MKKKNCQDHLCCNRPKIHNHRRANTKESKQHKSLKQIIFQVYNEIYIRVWNFTKQKKKKETSDKRRKHIPLGGILLETNSWGGGGGAGVDCEMKKGRETSQALLFVLWITNRLKEKWELWVSFINRVGTLLSMEGKGNGTPTAGAWNVYGYGLTLSMLQPFEYSNFLFGYPWNYRTCPHTTRLTGFLTRNSRSVILVL